MPRSGAPFLFRRAPSARAQDALFYWLLCTLEMPWLFTLFLQRAVTGLPGPLCPLVGYLSTEHPPPRCPVRVVLGMGRITRVPHEGKMGSRSSCGCLKSPLLQSWPIARAEEVRTKNHGPISGSGISRALCGELLFSFASCR